MLIAASIYCYLIKYRVKIYIYIYDHFTSQITNQEKFYINKCIIKMERNDKLKEIDIKNLISITSMILLKLKILILLIF